MQFYFTLMKSWSRVKLILYVPNRNEISTTSRAHCKIHSESSQ